MALQSSHPNAAFGKIPSRLLQLCLGSLLALSSGAQAGILSVEAQQANGIVTLNFFDSNPVDMCDADGFCYADFAIDFDGDELAFLPDSFSSPFLAMANSLPGGARGSQVLVSFLGDPQPTSGSQPLFSFAFASLANQQVTLSFGPRDFGQPTADPYTAAPIEVVLAPGAAVPEPTSILLAGIGLAGLAWSRKKTSGRKSQVLA